MIEQNIADSISALYEQHLRIADALENLVAYFNSLKQEN